ncbi:non-specific lipid transfer protein GPI-anchored 1-like [Juglans microcarpa x Juglans regia]|uniref:non-specific lipid transfer protein GPI-anchored 1-like n=1 Tax=Juglans microcarpa x Juglans regia TaxID=2249226 RepID=UPI001B7DAE30|nr:non-specific lipid transfer protein GPI-anchored 1-like [Juglans microcarpa x Juglans regia]
MKAQSYIISTLFWFSSLQLIFCGLVRNVGAADLTANCTNDFEKVVPCLNFVTGKEATPIKDCCSSVTEIRDNHPECLCYFIQQTYNGSEQIKSLGVQEDRLLQLPSACSLKNASISYCPKLLGISPTSPDAAAFTNDSTATPSSSASSTGIPSSPANSNDSSLGFRVVVAPHLAGLLAMALITIILFAFPISSTPTGSSFLSLV